MVEPTIKMFNEQAQTMKISICLRTKNAKMQKKSFISGKGKPPRIRFCGCREHYEYSRSNITR